MNKKKVKRRVKSRAKRVLTINRLVDMNNVDKAIDKKIQEALAIARIRESIGDTEGRTQKFWVTGAGVRMNVMDMEEGHLRNAISLCSRRVLGNLSRAVWVADTHDYIKNLDMLLEEAKRRGIRI